MTIEGRFENPEVGFRGVGLRVPGGTGHFELLEPLGEDSYLHKFLEEKGPGLHHVTFEVEDADRAAEASTGVGFKPCGGVRRPRGPDPTSKARPATCNPAVALLTAPPCATGCLPSNSRSNATSVGPWVRKSDLRILQTA